MEQIVGRNVFSVGSRSHVLKFWKTEGSERGVQLVN